MILISGTTLTKEELPNYIIMDYQIENDIRTMGIKLKTSAKSDSCFQIYIAEELREEYTITAELEEKLFYFNSDSDLIRLLNGEEEDCFAEKEEPNTGMSDFSQPIEVPEFNTPTDIFEPNETNDVPDFNEGNIPEFDETEGVSEADLFGKSLDDNRPVVYLGKSDNLEDEEIENENASTISDENKDVDFEPVDVEVKDETEPKITVNLKKDDMQDIGVVSDSTSENIEIQKSEYISAGSDISDISPKVNMSKGDTTSVIPEIDLELADTELPDSILMIPNFGDDIDSLRMLLKNKDGLIAQKDGVIKDLQNKIDEAYRLQEIQLEEVESLYKKKIQEFQSVINDLEQRGAGVNLDFETSQFLKYINYAKNNKAIVKEGLTEDEMSKMGVLQSKYTIFSYGSGESSYSMFKQIKKYIERGRDTVVIDFSNDNFLASVFKINSKVKNTMGLLRDDIYPLNLLSNVYNTKFIATTSFNDIALLNADWGTVLRKIDDLASGKDVILIFGAINNFSVRYTVSKLATIGKLFIFAKCSPIVLSSLYSDVQFIPKNRVRLVALEYIDVVKTILSELSKSFEIFAFSGDIEWHKLGLK